MPGLSGREVLKRVQQNHPATPVIVISGNSNTEAAAELIAMGAFAYLTKPFPGQTLVAAISKALASRSGGLRGAGEK